MSSYLHGRSPTFNIKNIFPIFFSKYDIYIESSNLATTVRTKYSYIIWIMFGTKKVGILKSNYQQEKIRITLNT